jgi:hypothetical protein
MATWDRGYIVNNSLLGFFQRLALSALLVLMSGYPAQAATESVVAPTAQPPIHLAWDRVGSPIQIRA